MNVLRILTVALKFATTHKAVTCAHVCLVINLMADIHAEVCSNVIFMLTGYLPLLDINECNGNHGCHHFCVNIIGSYKCDCFLGYTLDNDNVSCIRE